MLCALLLPLALTLPQEAPTLLLVPDKFEVALGTPIMLRTEQLDATMRAQRVGWPPALSAFFWRSSTTQENRDTMRPDAAGDVVTLPFTDSDVVMIGMTLPARDVVVAGDELRAMLPASAPLRETIGGQVRVREVRACKTLVRVGATQPSTIAVSKTTQPVELRPMLDPTHVSVGGDVAFRLHVNGAAVPHANVVAIHRASGTREDLVTDPIGACHFTITRAGEWIVVGYALQLEGEDAPGKWRRSIATLTFATLASGGGR